MKKITFLFLMFLSTGVFSQCYTTTKDDFLNAIIKKTDEKKVTAFSSSFVMWSSFSKINISNEDSYTFNFFYNNGKKAYLVTKGSSLILLLNNESKITLSSLDNYKTEINSYSGIISYRIHGSYIITKEQLESIRKSGIKKIRVYYDDTYSDEEINEKINSKLNELIDCILSAN